jgi:hypothetical protein
MNALLMVRTERLELSHLAAPEPKSGVSTNFTTSAKYLLLKTIKISFATGLHLLPFYFFAHYTE